MPDNTPNAPDDRPATLRDIAAAEQRIVARLTGDIAAAEQRTVARLTGDIAAAGQRTVDRLTEVMRDMQTEILTGLQSFARGNFARMHTLEATQSDTSIRIAALEERMLYLETRRPPQ